MKQFLVLTLVLLLAAFSCTDETAAPAPTSTCASLVVSFKADVQPVLAAKCGSAGCHPGYTTYSGVSRIASNGQFKREVITTRSMPPTGSLTAAQLQQISCWLDSGAPNN